MYCKCQYKLKESNHKYIFCLTCWSHITHLYSYQTLHFINTSEESLVHKTPIHSYRYIVIFYRKHAKDLMINTSHSYCELSCFHVAIKVCGCIRHYSWPNRKWICSVSRLIIWYQSDHLIWVVTCRWFIPRDHSSCFIRISRHSEISR